MEEVLNILHHISGVLLFGAVLLKSRSPVYLTGFWLYLIKKFKNQNISILI